MGVFGHVPNKYPGDTLTARDIQTMREAVIGNRLIPTRDPRITSLQTGDGKLINIKHSATRWVYAVGLTTDGYVLVKDAIPLDSSWGATRRWSIAPGNSSMDRVRPAPGYGIQHFLFHVLDEPQPKASDPACRVEGGYVVPDFRMQPVSPAAVSSICGPCPPGSTSATGPQTVMRRKPKCGDCGQKIKQKMQAQHDIDTQLGLSDA